MSYGKNTNVGSLVYDNSQTEVDDSPFPQSSQDQWNGFYPDSEELLMPKIPILRSHYVNMSTYVDSDHADNVENRRSHTGILIYLNNSLIIWFSKRQNTVESSSFGSKVVALIISTKLLVSLS